MKKVLDVLEYIAMFIWQLPQNIVALVMWPFLGEKELVKKDKLTRGYAAKNMRGGISLGSFVFVSRLSNRPETLAHEFGHCVDSRMMGPLYLFIIGIPSMFWAIFKPWKACYYSFFTERRANRHAGLEVVEGQFGCRTRFKKEEKAEKEIQKEEKKETISSAISKLAKIK